MKKQETERLRGAPFGARFLCGRQKENTAEMTVFRKKFPKSAKKITDFLWTARARIFYNKTAGQLKTAVREL